NVCGISGGRLPALPVGYELHRDKKPSAADIPDTSTVFGNTRQPTEQVLPDVQCVLLQLFFPQHIEHGSARGGGNGIAAERVEVMAISREGFRDVAASYRGGQWVAVAHGLAHGHDVGHHVVQLETP